MNREQIQAEAIERARNGQSLTNYPAIFEGLMAKGIAADDIKPRENVFTFNAWKALGRSVKKGEKGVKVVTFVDCSSKDRDPSSGEEKTVGFRAARTTYVFHISQTETDAEREARRGAAPARHPRSNFASGHGRYPSVDPAGFPDPAELAADRWSETHR